MRLAPYKLVYMLMTLLFLVAISIGAWARGTGKPYGLELYNASVMVSLIAYGINFVFACFAGLKKGDFSAVSNLLVWTLFAMLVFLMAGSWYLMVLFFILAFLVAIIFRISEWQRRRFTRNKDGLFVSEEV